MATGGSTGGGGNGNQGAGGVPPATPPATPPSSPPSSGRLGYTQAEIEAAKAEADLRRDINLLIDQKYSKLLQLSEAEDQAAAKAKAVRDQQAIQMTELELIEKEIYEEN